MPFLQTLGGGSAQGFKAASTGSKYAIGGFEYFYTEGGVYYKCHIFNYDYTSNGKFGGLNLTVLDNIPSASVFVVGAGGGGANFAGNDATFDANGGAAGGGGGGAALKTATLVKGATYTITVGQGGSGGNGQPYGTDNQGNSGQNGGNSSFVGTNFNVVANGGGGAGGCINGNDQGGGGGGSSSGGDNNWNGGNGANGQRNTGSNTDARPNPGLPNSPSGSNYGAGGGASGADNPPAGSLEKGGDGGVNLLGPFGCGGGGGGAIDYGGSPDNGNHSGTHNIVRGGNGYRNGGHGARISRPARDGEGPYGGKCGQENRNSNRMNVGSGGGYPGGGGGGGSDEKNSQASHDGGDGAHGMVVIRYALDDAPVASDFAYPSASNYPGAFIRDGSSGKGFHSALEAEIAGKANGNCYFRNAFNVEKELYIHTFTSTSPDCDGGTIPTSSLGTYILIASNNWGTGTFPSGTSRNDWAYQVDRGADNQDTASDQTANPNGDYLIGAYVHSLTYHRIKIFGWGWDRAADNLNFPNDCPDMMDATWQAGGIHYNVTKSNVTEYTNAGTQGTPALHPNAQHYCGDGIYGDWGFNANSNQCTIGGVGTGSTTFNLADSSTGCLTGHGSTEGTGEGWYINVENQNDCRGYTTWVR